MLWLGVGSLWVGFWVRVVVESRFLMHRAVGDGSLLPCGGVTFLCRQESNQRSDRGEVLNSDSFGTPVVSIPLTPNQTALPPGPPPGGSALVVFLFVADLSAVSYG